MIVHIKSVMQWKIDIRKKCSDSVKIEIGDLPILTLCSVINKKLHADNVSNQMLQCQNQPEIGDSNQWGRPHSSDHRGLIVSDKAATVAEPAGACPRLPGTRVCIVSLICCLSLYVGCARISLHISLSRDRESAIGSSEDTEEIF